jgi:hypothetical protein
MPTNHARPMIVDEPRIRTVRCPESVARPRGSAKQDKDDRCDPGRENRVRDDSRSPESERPGVGEGIPTLREGRGT